MEIEENDPKIKMILDAFNNDYKTVLLQELKKADNNRVSVLAAISGFYHISKDLRLTGQTNNEQIGGIAFPMLISFFSAYATQRNPNKIDKKKMKELINKYTAPKEKEVLLSSMKYFEKDRIKKNPENINELFELIYQMRSEFIHQAFLAPVPRKGIQSHISRLDFPKNRSKYFEGSILFILEVKLEKFQEIIEKIIIRSLNQKRDEKEPFPI